jgi:MinD-like ATPase involved in chromosome partitioning or flagellar assembly
LEFLEQYVVISQDRSVFKVFKEATGVDPTKISSSLAAKTILQDKSNKYEFIVIDIALKDSDSIVKLANKDKIPFLVIGEQIHKPLTIEAVKGAINSVFNPEEATAIEQVQKEAPEAMKPSCEEPAGAGSITNLDFDENNPDNEMLKELEAVWATGKNQSAGKEQESEKPKNQQNISLSPDLITQLKDEIISEIKKNESSAGKNTVELDKKPAPMVKVARQLTAAVWSAKAGIGKTFIVVNLGIIYAKAGLKTVIVDGDVFNLSVGIHLNLMEAEKTMERALKERNPLKVPDYLLQYPGLPNLSILSGSELCRPENYTGFSQSSMSNLINTLKERFDVILIDTATDPSLITTYEALKAANRVLVITTLDHAVTFNTKKYLALLKKIGVIEKKFRYILNKEFKSSKITRELIEKALGVQIRNTIPNSYEQVTESIFDSKPVMLSTSKDTQEIRAALTRLATDIYPYIDRGQFQDKISKLGFLKKVLSGVIK